MNKMSAEAPAPAPEAAQSEAPVVPEAVDLTAFEGGDGSVLPADVKDITDPTLEEGDHFLATYSDGTQKALKVKKVHSRAEAQEATSGPLTADELVRLDREPTFKEKYLAGGENALEKARTKYEEELREEIKADVVKLGEGNQASIERQNKLKERREYRKTIVEHNKAVNAEREEAKATREKRARQETEYAEERQAALDKAVFKKRMEIGGIKFDKDPAKYMAEIEAEVDENVGPSPQEERDQNRVRATKEAELAKNLEENKSQKSLAEALRAHDKAMLTAAREAGEEKDDLKLPEPPVRKVVVKRLDDGSVQHTHEDGSVDVIPVAVEPSVSEPIPVATPAATPRLRDLTLGPVAGAQEAAPEPFTPNVVSGSPEQAKTQEEREQEVVEWYDSLYKGLAQRVTSGEISMEEAEATASQMIAGLFEREGADIKNDEDAGRAYISTTEKIIDRITAAQKTLEIQQKRSSRGRMRNIGRRAMRYLGLIENDKYNDSGSQRTPKKKTASVNLLPDNIEAKGLNKREQRAAMAIGALALVVLGLGTATIFNRTPVVATGPEVPTVVATEIADESQEPTGAEDEREQSAEGTEAEVQLPEDYAWEVDPVANNTLVELAQDVIAQSTGQELDGETVYGILEQMVEDNGGVSPFIENGVAVQAPESAEYGAPGWIQDVGQTITINDLNRGDFEDLVRRARAFLQ